MEKLLEFDLDQDGQLSDMEVELQQPGIQKYLDKYAELLKAEEEDKDEEEEEAVKAEEPKKAQKTEQNKEEKATGEVREDKVSQPKDSSPKQTPKQAGGVQKEAEAMPPASSSRDGAIEDEDDGVEIEVVDEMVIVADDGIDSGTGSSITMPVLVASVVGVVTMVACVWCTVVKSSQQAKQLQKEGQFS